MMARSFVLRVGVVLILGSAVVPLAAQELLALSDGSTIEAKVERRRGGVLLKSAFGEREAPADLIVQRLQGDDLRSLYEERAAEIPKGFLGAHFALAEWCLEQGLLNGAKEQLEAVLELDIDHEGARALVAELGTRWDSVPVERSTQTKDQDDFARALFEEVAPRSVVDAVIARAKAERLPPEQTLRPALKGLRHETPWVRWTSAAVLLHHRNEPERIHPLYKRALLDPAFAVRREAVRALAVTRDPVFVKLFAKNLRHPKDTVRVAAGEALGELGLPEAIPHLLAALEDSWRPVRNYIISTTQRAYVKDFDVEVAQSAVIADPIVDVVQEGAVLDVAVVAISVERATYASSLARLTGARLGTDPAAWRSFLRASGSR